MDLKREGHREEGAIYSSDSYPGVGGVGGFHPRGGGHGPRVAYQNIRGEQQ